MARNRRHTSNRAKISRCAAHSVGSGFLWNHNRLMHRGCLPARMIAGSSSVSRSSSLTVGPDSASGRRPAIERIANEAPLGPERLDHPLKGDWADHRECRIGGDFLLIYRLDGNTVIFVRAGTHSDLFEAQAAGVGSLLDWLPYSPHQWR